MAVRRRRDDGGGALAGGELDPLRLTVAPRLEPPLVSGIMWFDGASQPWS